MGESSAEMLVSDVGVSEYGDKENSDISERYKIKSDEFPQYRLCTRPPGLRPRVTNSYSPPPEPRARA